MPIQRLYTGRNSSVVLPSGERVDRAQQGMNNLILEAEKMKLDSFKKNEEWYLKTNDVPIETYISTANTEAQAKMVDAYNKQAQDILKARGGDFNNLTTQDKLELAKGRKILESQQQSMLGDLEKYKMARDVINKNQDKYDLEEANDTIFKPYLTTGKFNDAPLPIKAQSLDSFLDNNKVRGSVTNDYEYYTNPNGLKVKQPVKVIGTEIEARDFVKNRILSNEANQKWAFKEFAKQPENVQLQYLDVNKDGKVDNSERGGAQDLRSEENPIVRWAQDTRWKKARQIVEGSETGAAQQNSGNFSIFNGFGKKTTYTPTEARPVTIGQTDYKAFHDFGNLPAKDIAVNTNIRVLDAEAGDTVKQPKTPITADLVAYDEDKDEFVFIATKNWYDFDAWNGAKGKDIRFAVKRSELGKEYGDFEIMKDGKKVKIGNITPSTATPTKNKPTWPEYKAANPTKTIEDYKVL